MGNAWVFFITFTVIFWTSSAQTCDKKTCDPQSACARDKCLNQFGIGVCVNQTEAEIKEFEGFKVKHDGGRNWCKYHRRCKCAYKPICENRRKCDAVQGTCKNLTEAAVWQDEFGGEVKWRGRGDWCKDYKLCKCCLPLPTTTTSTTTTAATTTPPCPNPCVHGECKDGACDCDPFWTGPTCDEFFCPDPCQHGGTCTGPNECNCTNCWTGSTCEDFRCADDYCQNGGTCSGPCECACPSGWKGPTCDEIDCDPKCKNGGTCTGPNVCTCQTGWRGPVCEEFYCDPECQNGGNCTGPNECTCPPGWAVPSCDVFFCDKGCEHEGNCTGPNECTCTDEYNGDVCQHIVCANRQLCDGKSGVCYAKNHPILTNSTACPKTDNGKKWCTPMCACCFGA